MAGALYLVAVFLVPADGRHALLIGLIPAVLIALAIRVLFSVEKHQDSAPEEAFIASLLGGVASWWLPSLLFLLPFEYLFLLRRRALDGRTFSGSLMALLVVAIYAALAIWQEWIPLSWYPFFRLSDLWTMVPILLILIVIFVVTNVQQNRRVR